MSWFCTVGEPTEAPPAARPPLPRWVRRIYTLAVGLALAVGAGMVVGADAHADPILFNSCPAPPAPEAAGHAGFIGDDSPTGYSSMYGPDAAMFDGASTYWAYGEAGTYWPLYDQGCHLVSGPSDWAMTFSNGVLNFQFWCDRQAHALSASLNNFVADPGHLRPLDPIIVAVSKQMHDGVYNIWLAAAFAVMGLWMLVRYRRLRFADLATALMMATVVMGVVTYLSNYPLRAEHKSDEVVSTLVGSVAGSINGHTPASPNDRTSPAEMANGALYDVAIWKPWQSGMLGDNPTTLTDYSFKIHDSMAASWSQMAQCEKAHNCAAMFAAKRNQFFLYATTLKGADPGAYDRLRGSDPFARLMAGARSWLILLFTVPFAILSSVMTLLCFLIVRVAIMFAPVLGIFGIVPYTQAVTLGAGKVVVASAVNTALFGGCTAVFIGTVGAVFDPQSGVGLLPGLLFMLFLTVAFFAVTRPMRRMTEMLPAGGAKVFGAGVNSPGKVTHQAKRAVVAYTKAKWRDRDTAEAVVKAQRKAVDQAQRAAGTGDDATPAAPPGPPSFYTTSGVYPPGSRVATRVNWPGGPRTPETDQHAFTRGLPAGNPMATAADSERSRWAAQHVVDPTVGPEPRMPSPPSGAPGPTPGPTPSDGRGPTNPPPSATQRPTAGGSTLPAEPGVARHRRDEETGTDVYEIFDPSAEA